MKKIKSLSLALFFSILIVPILEAQTLFCDGDECDMYVNILEGEGFEWMIQCEDGSMSTGESEGEYNGNCEPILLFGEYPIEVSW